MKWEVMSGTTSLLLRNKSKLIGLLKWIRGGELLRLKYKVLEGIIFHDKERENKDGHES
jgi:hypothetical protein